LHHRRAFDFETAGTRPRLRYDRFMNMPLNIGHLEAAFAGEPVTTPQGDVTCFVRHAGDLILSTGRVVACDPLVFPEAESFTVAVAPGSYPVLLAVAEVGDKDQRVAFAKLQFAAQKPETWQMAVLAEQDTATLSPDEIFGYPVDAGTGCFMDIAASALLVSRMNAEDEYYEVIIEAMQKTYVHTWSYASVQPSPLNRDNCIAFSSGWGDGVYASYFGYSAAGDVVCLVTDFEVL
jgi:hypothetical protein